MKNKQFKRRPKRTTFWKIFAKAMILPILLTVFVGFNIVPLGHSYIQSRTEAQNETDFNNFANLIVNGSELEEAWNRPIEFPICLSASRVITTDGIFFNTGASQYIMGTTYDDPKSASARWAFDSDGNILISNRAKMWVVLRFSSADDGRRYCKFDPEEFDIPEMNELFAEYFKDVKENDLSYEFHLKSLYFNEKTNRMIPHEFEVSKYKNNFFYDDFGNALLKDEPEIVETKSIVINADEEGFELIEFADRNSPDDYPRSGFFSIWGVDPVTFDEIYDRYKVETKVEKYRLGMQGNGDNTNDFYHKEDLAENKYGASGCISVTRINLLNKHAVRKYVLITAMVFIISTLIALVLSIVKNAKNKAQYAFEDYQRALTNNLAHDLKTPLAVIGGYAENLIEMRRDSADEKELNYLSSIMDNVAYTDNIVARTLQLSRNEQIKKLNKKKVDIKALAENLSAKYRTVLEERDIGLNIEGGAVVNADEELLASAVENLISNAVKYTKDGGSINITADKKSFNIVNDVVENVDTKDLLMPFVKGDKARSDKSSSGLGLAIAASAAAANGFILKIECKEKKFKAVISF